VKINLAFAACCFFLTACGDSPSESQMLNLASAKLAMPKCAGRTASFVSRDPGGGWQGGGLTFKVAAPSPCMQQWIDLLDDRFACAPDHVTLDCKIDLNGAREGADIQMKDYKTMQIYLWSLT
jgi:hypothetical protein